MVQSNEIEQDTLDGLYSQTHEERALLKELEYDNPEPIKISEADIEELYTSAQSNIYIQRNDFLIPNILQMVRDKEIFDITPPYQRRLRWSDKKKSHLIESLLMNVPIPPIFLYEKEFAKYEVMDGQQRLKTIISFYNNEFKLRDLSKWSVLNKRYYSDLPPKIQAGLSRRGLAAVIVLSESSKDKETAMQLRQYIFERLNTGGQRLNAQEVRNCIYSSNFNDTLIRIARSPLFTSAWGIPPKEPGEPQHVSRNLARNALYSTMSDCQIVLRFFALSNLESYKISMKTFLDKFMEGKQKTSKDECQNLELRYLKVLKTATDIYREQLFKLPDRSGTLRGRRSIPLADVVLLSIDACSGQIDKLIKQKAYIIEETHNLLNRKENYNAIVGHGITKSAIEKRIGIFKDLMQRALALGD